MAVTAGVGSVGVLVAAAMSVHLSVEAELHHVAVLHQVVLALEADLAELLGARPAADVEQLVPADHLGLDEAALEVGVDAPGALRGGRPVEEGPRPRLLVAGG